MATLIAADDDTYDDTDSDGDSILMTMEDKTFDDTNDNTGDTDDNIEC